MALPHSNSVESHGAVSQSESQEYILMRDVSSWKQQYTPGHVIKINILRDWDSVITIYITSFKIITSLCNVGAFYNIIFSWS